MEKMETQELISALADGHLHGEAFARGVELAASSASGRQAWQTYHLIGDVLRSGELALAPVQPAFLERLQARLRDEPPLALAASPEPVVAEARRPAANDAAFRWKLVAGFASVAAVSAIVWSVAGIAPTGTTAGQLAKAAPPAPTVLTAGERGVMIRDARLDELLAAHRQLGGATPLQMSSGFVRNATFEGTGR
jgi:sigma-E factor negative regulatory protein RseA